MANFLTVLIADDNAADRLLLSTIVSRQGHRVLTAANGLEALALFEQERPQLVLMDALMPVMDGFEAARRIRRQAGEELVPIIFLTSLSETEALVQSLEAGGDDFLSKPYNRVILEAKIRAMGRLHHLQREVLAQRDLIARHNEHLLNEQRVAKAVLIGAIPPLMLKTPSNPRGLPLEVFDQLRASVLADRAQFFKDLSAPFYGANRPGSQVSQGLRDFFWMQGMLAGHKAVYDCIRAFSETDLTEDLKKIDVPTLILHGDDDQIVPIGASALMSSKIVTGSKLVIFPGAPHGMCSTLKDRVNQELLSFIGEK